MDSTAHPSSDKQHQDTARILVHVMRRMEDERFKRDGGRIVYLLDSDIVALYANPRNNLKYTDVFMPSKQDAEALSWTIVEYIFTGRRLGLTLMSPAHRFEAMGMLHAILLDAGKDILDKLDIATLLNFMRSYVNDRTQFENDGKFLKLLQSIYGYVAGASDNFRARRMLTAMRERWINSVEEDLDNIPLKSWPSLESEATSKATDAWQDTIQQARLHFKHQKEAKEVEEEGEALKVHKQLAADTESAEAMRDYADAITLASLQTANELLEKSAAKVRIVLVTGAPTLHLAAEIHGFSDGIGQHSSFGWQYLRHPLMLLAAPDLLPDIDSATPSQDLSAFFEQALQRRDFLSAGFEPRNRHANSWLLCEALFEGHKVPQKVAQTLGLAIEQGALKASYRIPDEFADELVSQMQQQLAKAIRVSAMKSGMRRLEDGHELACQDFSCLQDDQKKIVEKFQELLDAEGEKTTNEFLATLFDLGLEQFLKESKQKNKDTPENLEFRRSTPYIDFGKFDKAKAYYAQLSHAKDPRELVSSQLGELRKVMLDEDPTRYTMALVYGLVFAQFGSWDLCARCAEFALDIAKSGDPSARGHGEKIGTIYGEEAAYLLAYSLRHLANNVGQLDQAKAALGEAMDIWSERVDSTCMGSRFLSESLAQGVTRWTLARNSKQPAGQLQEPPESLDSLQSRLLVEVDKLPDWKDCSTQPDERVCKLEEQLLTNLFIVTLMREIAHLPEKAPDPDSAAIFSRNKHKGLKFYLDRFDHMFKCRKCAQGRISALVEAVFMTASAVYDKSHAGWNDPATKKANMEKLTKWIADKKSGLLDRDRSRLEEYRTHINKLGLGTLKNGSIGQPSS